MRDYILLGIYLLIFLVFAVMFVLTRKIRLPPDIELSSIKKPFYRTAIYLYRWKTKSGGGKAHGNGIFFQGGQVSKDLRTLDPSKHVKRKENIYYTEKIANLLMFVFMAALLATAIWGKQQSNKIIRTAQDGSQYIEREDYSGMETTVTAQAISVPGEDTDKKDAYGSYTITVGSRKYTEEELQSIADREMDVIKSQMLNGNESLSKVTGTLNLMTSIDGYPFQLDWMSNHTDLVDYDGTVITEGLEDGETKEVILTVTLRCQNYHEDVEIPITVTPPVYTEDEKIAGNIQKALNEEETTTENDETYVLPSTIEGRRIKWEEPVEDMSFLLMILIAGAGIVLYFASDLQLHHKVEDRGRQMRSDYPQIVSKFALYIGAGMSVRNVFYRLGEEYKKEKEKGGEKRYAYEEILLVCNELDSGVSEHNAYVHFGIRCRQRQYTKFSALLTQNLKKGNAALLASLQEEAEHSFEERKLSARQLGEEAGTKMLVPMVMLLTVTMIIIVVPVFISL